MIRRLALVLAVVVATAGSAPASSGPFALETSAFLDGGALPRLDAAAAGDCGGRNVSPPLRIAGTPANARSLALVILDTDANVPHGFVHWIAYGIAPTASSIGSGFGSQASTAYVGGTNDAGTTVYFGPCPPVGDPPHHYVFTAYALDLGRARLGPGLTRAAFLSAARGHTLASASITATYVRAR